MLPSYYGDRELVIPDSIDVEVLSPQVVRVPPRMQVINSALNSPLGTLPLEQLIYQKKKKNGHGIVCIICEDMTRHSPTNAIIPIILDQLNDDSVPDRDIFVVIALGTHRPMTKDEIRMKVGEEVCNRVAVYNSEFHDKNKLVYLGSYGDYPLWLDRRVAEADIRIGVGSVIPHPVAGWSGGAKIVIPGVTGEETVGSFHLSSHEFRENMFGREITLSRELIERLVRKIGLDFVVNSVYTPEGEIYTILCGDFIQAQRAAVKRAKEVYCTSAKRKAQLVISNSYPADGDFWQAGKALHSGDIVAEDGGEIVLVTSCPEGIGPHSSLPDLFERAIQDRAQLLRDTQSGKVADVVAASSALMRTRTIMSRKRLGLVSEYLDRKTMERLGFTVYESIEHMLKRNLTESGTKIKVSVLTHGGSTLPLLS